MATSTAAGPGGAPPRYRDTSPTPSVSTAATAANPTGGSAAATTQRSGGGTTIRPNAPPVHPTHVSEPAYEFLLGEMLHWVEAQCDLRSKSRLMSAKDNEEGVQATPESPTDGGAGVSNAEEEAILAAERAAAKIERMGFTVGHRLCERLAQSKPLGPPPPPPGATNPSSSSTVTSGQDPTAISQLEAVKFLCKEFWTEVFRKQIDKLQTNHRGVFVLKDHELRWLRRLPPDDERARVAAIKMLAFPCGLIRGALSNLGIGAVVSCDFLADGKNMAACSFNIKIK